MPVKVKFVNPHHKELVLTLFEWDMDAAIQWYCAFYSGDPYEIYVDGVQLCGRGKTRGK